MTPTSEHGRITVPVSVSPEPHELETARRVAAAGYSVRFREIDTTKGAKNPDVEIDGVETS